MNKPIRILHVLQRMEAGGTQALLMNIYRNIDRNKVQFDFLVEYPNKEFYDDEIIKLGGKIYYSNVRNDHKIFKFQKQLKKILKDHSEYKIIHVHAYTIGYFCLKTAKECGIPVRIAHSHNNETVRDKKYVLKKIMQKLYTMYATDLFACSEEAGKYLFKNNKFTVLNNSIDSSKFIFSSEKRNKIRKELNVEENFVVGHVGRLHQQKNHMFLLKIFKEIKQIRKDAKLILIGNGPLEQQIKDKVKELELNDDVFMLGNKSNVNEYMMAMDIFLLPSLFEGLGIVAIESQATGTATLTSDKLPKETNISSLIEYMSLNVNEKEWAKKTIEMYQKKKVNQDMSQYVINFGFDVKKNAKDMEEYYIKKNNIVIER